MSVLPGGTFRFPKGPHGSDTMRALFWFTLKAAAANLKENYRAPLDARKTPDTFTVDFWWAHHCRAIKPAAKSYIDTL